MSALALDNRAAEAVETVTATATVQRDRHARLARVPVRRPTVVSFFTRHGYAFLRLAPSIVQVYRTSSRLLGSARNTDDVWTAAEMLQPVVERLVDVARSDDWVARANDLPEIDESQLLKFSKRLREVDALHTKWVYWLELAQTVRRAPRGSASSRPPGEVPPTLRRITGYIPLLVPLMTALRFDATLPWPLLSDSAYFLASRAASEALSDLIAFALAVDGRLDPPPGLELPRPLDLGRIFDEWERVQELRRASDGVVE